MFPVRTISTVEVLSPKIALKWKEVFKEPKYSFSVLTELMNASLLPSTAFTHIHLNKPITHYFLPGSRVCSPWLRQCKCYANESLGYMLIKGIKCNVMNLLASLSQITYLQNRFKQWMNLHTASCSIGKYSCFSIRSGETYDAFKPGRENLDLASFFILVVWLTKDKHP